MKRSVRLVGEVRSKGRDGPSNGMYALQLELRKRMAAGLDWLSIGPDPGRDMVQWFWNWADRRRIAECDREGVPFIVGPNVVFLSSGSPRGDELERTILDAKNCRAMFCHSEWYRELTEEHKGATNCASVYTWPYPIADWPEPPLPAEFDLLVYVKGGPQWLPEKLAEVFPKTAVIRYGRFEQSELFAAASKSSCCLYICTDDHGPLAQAEILLAGCPVVGVRRGAPFVVTGLTGLYIDRFPEAIGDDYYAMIETINTCQTLSRAGVRQRAEEMFSTERIADDVISHLEAVR